MGKNELYMIKIPNYKTQKGEKMKIKENVTRIFI